MGEQSLAFLALAFDTGHGQMPTQSCDEGRGENETGKHGQTEGKQLREATWERPQDGDIQAEPTRMGEQSLAFLALAFDTGHGQMPTQSCDEGRGENETGKHGQTEGKQLREATWERPQDGDIQAEPTRMKTTPAGQRSLLPSVPSLASLELVCKEPRVPGWSTGDHL
ncbi:hypothetical protein H920_11638 [Fukomys damarensis]|uniref:Uncharacterized protein n=1 Tax=Fukomys damarensis TaxID=885580 RepID=A0A091D9K3_FUKDA|nr:hypothetical protein H920_11638 [Fukomys damarensis]